MSLCLLFFLTLYHTIPTFNYPEILAFWKHCKKRIKCCLPAFSPFPIMFSNPLKANLTFWVTFILSSAIASNLDKSKSSLFGKELNQITKQYIRPLTLSQRTPGFHMSAVYGKSFENTVGKGEITRYAQFLLFPLCFQHVSAIFIKLEIVVCKLFQFGSLKFVVWERFYPLLHRYSF